MRRIVPDRTFFINPHFILYYFVCDLELIPYMWRDFVLAILRNNFFYSFNLKFRKWHIGIIGFVFFKPNVPVEKVLLRRGSFSITTNFFML